MSLSCGPRSVRRAPLHRLYAFVVVYMYGSRRGSARRLRVPSPAMAARIVVFGATGYTGRLVAERLVAQGARPVLAGRDDARVAALAEELGGLEHARADALRQNSVFELVGSDDVLVSTVGPFVKWGGAAVRAATAAGATYLDSTGEPAFIRQVFQEHS